MVSLQNLLCASRDQNPRIMADFEDRLRGGHPNSLGQTVEVAGGILKKTMSFFQSCSIVTSVMMRWYDYAPQMQ
jgi:hypothetical protein